MRIIRFVDSEGRVVLGEDHRDGDATVLLDADGLLGPRQDDLARRALLRGKRALIADDDAGIRQTVDETLRRFDCACTVCKDGAEALSAIGKTDLDVVVSDIVMPHHDGYEVFAAAKQRSDRLAVVLITGFGYDPNHTVLRACQQGCEEVLYKPFTPLQLVQKICNAMRASANGQGGPLVRDSERLAAGTPLAPLMPRDILCAGRNYGLTDVGDLELFMKPRSAVQDPGEPIRIPDGTDPDVACEGELAVVIGSTATNVTEAEALDHVFGYLIANDVTARRWQKADLPMSWMRGKGFDTFCPIGPAIVTADEVPDPGNLQLTTTVNGRVVRRGNTSQMSRSVARLISEISRVITLHPGTLLLTGAPPLLDDAPADPLRDGDEVCVEIDGIGKLVNPVAG
jgi:2-keto-4-pentenoate hydratase/2-oxohepta-3-ene-1,7-dioic acid hydratase in catechol pathway